MSKKSIYIKFVILIVAMLFVFSGCMQVETVVNVDKNGSGTIDLKMVLSKKVAKSLQSMSGENTDGEIKNQFTEDSFNKIAKVYGDGVVLRSYKEVNNDDYIGGTGVFVFEDINNLKITPMPEENQSKNGDDSYYKFKYKKKGNKKYLTIITPAGEEEETKSEEEKAKSWEQAKLMKELLKNMYMSIKVNIDGKIVRANAKSVKKSEITLMAVDFNKILEDDKVFEGFITADNKTSAMKSLDKIDGIIYENKDKVEVVYK